MAPNLSILLPAARMGADGDPQAAWGDVRVALSSIAEYAPGVDVVLAWNGREEPRGLPDNPCVRLVKQIDGIRTASAAWNFAATQTDAEQILLLGDDCVLTPDTLPLMLEDVAMIRESEPGLKLGVVGARSNFVKGPQNVRAPNGSTGFSFGFPSEKDVIEAEMIVPIAAWVMHEAYDEVGGMPDTNWYGDDLLCWDLRNLGYRHFVSRAYVHHVGQRATSEGKSGDALFDEGISWLRENRPDYLRDVLGIV